MTESEAIVCLQADKEYLTDMNICDGEEMDFAIKALEKQIPKKIVYRNQTYGTPWLCPICEADQIKVEFFNDDGSQTKEKYSFCWKCGQSIDWSK